MKFHTTSLGILNLPAGSRECVTGCKSRIWQCLMIACVAVTVGCDTSARGTRSADSKNATDVGMRAAQASQSRLERDTSPQTTPMTIQQVRQVNSSSERALKNHHAEFGTAINSRNVSQMQMAWKKESSENISHTPLIEGNRLYYADWGGTIFALNARDGSVIWSNKVEKPMTQWPWHGFSGTGCLGEGMLFEASTEGNIFALDQVTGKVRWKRKFTEDAQAGNCGELLYYDGLIFVPVSSVEEPLTKMQNLKPNFQGKVMAVDAKAGKTVWERQLVEAPQNGVAVWSGFALDPNSGSLFFTTGNNYTGKATRLSDAVIALDARTGAIRWAKQATPNDIWTMAEPVGPDYDFGAAPQLFEASIDGRVRKLLGAGQKSGRFWVLDRDTGQQVWSTTVGHGHIGGGMHAEASIGQGKIFVWGNNAFPYHNAEQHPMDVMALDAATGNYLWSKLKAQPAVLTSAGFLADDVYFVGSLDGKVRGYRASDGERLWTSQSTKPIASSLMVAGDMLYFGGGVPHHFGGKKGGGGGLYAFSAGRGTVPLAQADTAQSEELASSINEAAGASQDVRELTIVARSFDFDPSQIEATPGQRMRVVLTNASEDPHNIEFEWPQGEVELPSPIQPNQTGTLTFQAPTQPGSYVYYCPVGNHRERGMEGELIVREKGQPDTTSLSRNQERDGKTTDERTQLRTQTPPPEKLFGTWVAEDVPTDIGQARVQLTFRKKGPVTILAWSELPLVGKVRDIQGPFKVKGNTIISEAIRGGTQVQYSFQGDNLVIQYEDGKTVRFHRE